MFSYSWDTFKKEKNRYAWLSPLHTEESLKKEYYQAYLNYCTEHNLKAD